MELNNRELAVLIWVGIALIWMLSKRDLRGSLGQLLTTVVQPAVLLPILAFAAYVAAWAWAGTWIKAWHWGLINETVWWFLATGFVLLFSATRVSGEEDFFIPAAKRALTIAVFAEFFINLVGSAFLGRVRFCSQSLPSSS